MIPHLSEGFSSPIWLIGGPRGRRSGGRGERRGRGAPPRLNGRDSGYITFVGAGRDSVLLRPREVPEGRGAAEPAGRAVPLPLVVRVPPAAAAAEVDGPVPHLAEPCRALRPAVRR